MNVLVGLLIGFLAVIGVAVLGGLTVLLLGGIIASAGWLLGILAGALDAAIWVMLMYWMFKTIKSLF